MADGTLKNLNPCLVRFKYFWNVSTYSCHNLVSRQTSQSQTFSYFIPFLQKCVSTCNAERNDPDEQTDEDMDLEDASFDEDLDGHFRDEESEHIDEEELNVSKSSGFLADEDDEIEENELDVSAILMSSRFLF
jgi:hypothetical protein